VLNTGGTDSTSAWKYSFFPTFALLGFALPVLFFATIEQYLYYLRPLELIPTYGTAWLLLAIVTVPTSLALRLALDKLTRPGAQAIRGVLSLSLLGFAAASTAAALAYGVLTWLRIFSLFENVHVAGKLGVLSLALGALAAARPTSRAVLLRLYPVTARISGFGALTLLSLPISGWNIDSTANTPAGSQISPLSRSRPHVLLITIDALSATHMSLYGAARQTSPSLDAFANKATTFDRAYANGNFTTPAVSSILTGTRPWTHRALQLASWPTATTRRSSLPALLHEAGYQTGYVATNAAAGAARNGFSSFFDFGSSDQVPIMSICRDAVARRLPYECPASQLPVFLFAQLLLNRARLVVSHSNRHFDPQTAIRPALDWLKHTDKRAPIFLWVHFLPPHAPYAAPQPWLGQFDSSLTARNTSDSDTENAFMFTTLAKARARTLEARYDESVSYVDHYVGEFLHSALEVLGDDTVVIVTADHGESFSHGYGGHAGPGLFESLIRIPLLIRLPLQTQGARISTLAEQVDIAPTVAELAGLSPAESWEGHSLLGLLRSGVNAEAATVPIKSIFAMNFEENPRRAALATGSICVIEGQWKLVHYMGPLHYPLMPRLDDELYDLSIDPGELSNRISDSTAEAEHLLEQIHSELAGHGVPLP
jgi:arylsulfatase A-like enzyme